MQDKQFTFKQIRISFALYDSSLVCHGFSQIESIAYILEQMQIIILRNKGLIYEKRA